MPSLDFSVSPKWSVDEIALKNYTIEQLNRHVVMSKGQECVVSDIGHKGSDAATKDAQTKS